MDRRIVKRVHSIVTASVTAIQGSVAFLTQTARREFPLAMAFTGLTLVGLERMGERASRSRTGWVMMFMIPAMMFTVGPASAQPNCNEGFLQFIGSVETLTIQSVGMIFGVIIATAAVLKAVPVRGTNSIGNQLLGGFMVGVGFFVLGPAFVDLADSATPIDMSAECNTGGS